MPTVRLWGIDISYEHGGIGPRLLFINGSGATLESAALLVARFRGDFELLAHDQRGLGHTSVPDTPRRTHDVRDRLGRIKCPTFVAAGRYDGIAPLSNSEAIVAAVPGAELHTYDGGHRFVAQDPTALPEIVAFLGT